MMRIARKGAKVAVGRFGFAGLAQNFLSGGQERGTEIISLTI